MGVFGGTFDPVHQGHLCTVASVRQQLDLAHVLFVPAARPRLRSVPAASAAHRLEMLKRALASEPSFHVNDLELGRDGPSTTVLTLEALHHDYQETPICFILGIDAFLGLPQWHRWTELLGLAHFVVMSRPGTVLPVERPTWWVCAETADLSIVHRRRAGSIVMVEVPPMDVAASNIRERLRAGDDVSPSVPKSVIDYITEHRLYDFDF
jgi:nicotinate-nucleotide adenylyltransferase